MILGIDYDTHAIYPCLLRWAEIDANYRPTFLGPIEIRGKRDTGEDSLWRALARVHDAIELGIPWHGTPDLYDDEPDVCWIERGQTSTGMRGPFMLGAVFGAIVASCGELIVGGPSLVNVIETREWKREVAPDAKGGGNAKKPETHRVMIERWPFLERVDGNHIDAFGIALAGMRLNERALAT